MDLATTDTMLEDILAQLHERQQALEAEHQRILDIARTLAPGRIEVRRISGSFILPAATNGHLPRATKSVTPEASTPSQVVLGDTRTMSDAARKRLSRRMKALWRERRAAGNTARLGARKK